MYLSYFIHAKYRFCGHGDTCLFVVLWTLVRGPKDLYSMVGKHDQYAGTIISGACDLLLFFYIHVPNFSKKKKLKGMCVIKMLKIILCVCFSKKKMLKIIIYTISSIVT